MSNISSVSSVGPSRLPSGVSGLAGQKESAEKPGFGQVLKDYLGEVNQDQQSAAQAIQQLLTGKSQDVLPVVAAVAEADLSFKLLMGIRNKVIEAYKQTMNMQI